MTITADQVKWVLIGVLVLIVSTAFHEFGHAWMADRLGDDTPRRQGRVTLNPVSHIDPIGTLLLPLLGGFYGAASGHAGGFGWGKPVQWQPHKIRRGMSMSTANILVSLAGPFMNLFVAIVVSVVQSVLVHKHVIAADPLFANFTHDLQFDDSANYLVSSILSFTVITNFILMFFNLVPSPPLDGGHVLEALMPRKYQRQFEAYAKFGPFVVMAVALIPQVSQIFRIPAFFCAEHLYKAWTALFG